MNNDPAVNKHGTIVSVALLCSILQLLILTGCGAQTQTPQQQTSGGMSSAVDSIGSGGVERLEVFHFHGNNQCTSCIAVGALAEETINVYFSAEIASGKIRFAHINAELPENAALAKQYGATGSSLWIGTYRKDGTFIAEQNTNVWYKINDKEDYTSYLKGIIEQKLTAP